MRSGIEFRPYDRKGLFGRYRYFSYQNLKKTKSELLGPSVKTNPRNILFVGQADFEILSKIAHKIYIENNKK